MPYVVFLIVVLILIILDWGVTLHTRTKILTKEQQQEELIMPEEMREDLGELLKELPTEEVREGLVELFELLINTLPDKQHKISTEKLVAEGIAPLAGTSKQEQMKMVKTMVNSMSRERLIKTSHEISNGITDIIKREVNKQH